jgi:ABC-2 type transport system permease protein
MTAAYRWELRKLAAQRRTYLGLAGMVALPALLVLGLALSEGTPQDGLFGRYARETGLAAPLIMLAFASAFMLPLMASLVAGDIVANEDGNGTLKTILTRSVDRGAIFAAKALAALTYAALGLAVFGLASLGLGVAFYGLGPLPSLSGSVVEVPRGLLLIGGALLAYLIPLSAVAAIGVLLSTVTRNSAAAVVGTLLLVVLLSIVQILPGLEGVEPFLLTSRFDGWQGLLREPVDWSPVVESAVVSAAYGLPALAAAWLVFLRRDVAGG